tara:strand:+ start:6603 stop:6848 length:246 start_codon:yes stop_codon:yes gene_type:complete
MEEAQNPNIEPADVVPVFTAKTMHCETNEIGFMVAIMPVEINTAESFQDWLISQTVEVGLLPMVFEVKIGEEVIIAGGAQE